MSRKNEIEKFQICREGGKKYCYALEDFERLFYEGFSGKNNDCGTLCNYHKNRGMLHNGSDYFFDQSTSDQDCRKNESLWFMGDICNRFI